MKTSFVRDLTDRQVLKPVCFDQFLRRFDEADGILSLLILFFIPHVVYQFLKIHNFPDYNICKEG